MSLFRFTSLALPTWKPLVSKAWMRSLRSLSSANTSETSPVSAPKRWTAWVGLSEKIITYSGVSPIGMERLSVLFPT